ncbi:MAG: hypothetical protein JF586_10770 [Burkholderiales bacterium]|nr:hypothetical protein [Burkholderiales bacterium]
MHAMHAMTPFGIFHTLISLVAVIAGVISFFREGHISWSDRLGKTYTVFTIASCVTALFIFHHGGFGPPHIVAVLTLVMLAIAALARATRIFGRGARHVETLSYSATFLFHMIPAVTETATRLPPGAPWVDSPDSPSLKAVYLALLVAFLVGAVVQSRRLRHDYSYQVR